VIDVENEETSPGAKGIGGGKDKRLRVDFFSHSCLRGTIGVGKERGEDLQKQLLWGEYRGKQVSKAQATYTIHVTSGRADSHRKTIRQSALRGGGEGHRGNYQTRNSPSQHHKETSTRSPYAEKNR